MNYIKKGLRIGALSLTLLAVSALTEADPYATATEMGLMEGFPPAADKIVDRSSLLKGPGNRWS